MEEYKIEAAHTGSDNGEISDNKPQNKSEGDTSFLNQFCRNLNDMAKKGKLDVVVGRQAEIERVSQILSRRKKNNPILIGEPGCIDGKTLIKVRKVSDDGKHSIIIVE